MAHPATPVPNGISSHQPRMKRLGLTAAMWLASANIWTGAPLLALWIGSRTQGGGAPTMAGVFVVTIVMAALCYALVWLLGRLGEAHDRISGNRPSVRAHAPWLRSMSGERQLYTGERPQLTTLERVLVTMVVIVALVFEVWFFFFSSSPIDGRTGRVDAGPTRSYAAEPQEGSSSAMRKEEPQPQEATTLGLFTSKPAPIMLSA